MLNNIQDEIEEIDAEENEESLDSHGEASHMVSVGHQMSWQVAKNLSLEDASPPNVSDAEFQEQNPSSGFNDAEPEVFKPYTLYIYGGMMEIRDREITLDDLYMLNLSKLDKWKCIIPASESEWIDASENEDEDDSEEEESNSGSESDESSDEEDIEDSNGKTVEMGDAVALIKGEGRALRRKEKRARIEQIRASLGLSDLQRTPTPGESLKDFYKRTNIYWQMAAHEHTQHTGKELRKDGFDLAVTRYRELKPLLDELAILEAEQKAEEEVAESSNSRKKNKKSKQTSSRR